MSRRLHIKTHCKPEWSTVRTIRDRVESAVSRFPLEIKSATVMTASELVENAIKYGESLPEHPGIELSLTYDDCGLRLTVVSASSNIEAIRQLKRHTDALRASADKSELYMSRLQSLLERPDGFSRLGLYRICVEGSFELDCTYDNNVVRMTATRTIP